MSVDLKQYHLVGKGFSGRGVRLRELDGRESARAERCAAAKLGKEASMVEYRQAAALEFTCRMIVEVTTAPVAAPVAAPTSQKKEELSAAEPILKATWRRVTQEQLEEEDFKLLFELFTAKDIAWFTARWQREYEVSMAEVDAIEGKARTVVAD